MLCLWLQSLSTLGALSTGVGRMVPRMSAPDPLEPVCSVCDMVSSESGIKVIDLNMESGRAGLAERPDLMA